MPSTAPEPVLHVVAGAIRRGDQVLLARRHDHAHQGGLWEYPGGKLDVGETPEQGLRRELHEELGIDVRACRPLIRIPWTYPDRRVLLEVFTVSEFSGEPHGREGQPLQWTDIDRLDELDFPAANRGITRALQLPPYYLITPEPARPRRDWLDAIRHYAEAGGTLIQLRAKTLDSSDLQTLATQVRKLLWSRNNIKLLINGDPDLAATLGCGLHLTSTQLHTLHQRPDNIPGLIAASCHTPADIHHANTLGLDFIVLSPILEAKHPDQPLLGWHQFATLTAEATMPVYALGGISRTDLDASLSSGGQGIAAIRGLWPGRVGS